MALPSVEEKCILLGPGVCKQMESRRTISNYILIVFSFLFLEMLTRHRYGGKDCLTEALPSLTMLTLRLLSTLAANEMNPGALAHTAVLLFTKQGLRINQTGCTHQSWCPKKTKKLYLVQIKVPANRKPFVSAIVCLCVDFVKKDLFFLKKSICL